MTKFLYFFTGSARLAFIAPALSLVLFLCLQAVRADTPAQAQKAIQVVCDRAVVSYEHRDLAGFMAIYSPGCIIRNVQGRKTNFYQIQAGVAAMYAKGDYMAIAHCTVSRVVIQSNQARAVLHWNYVTHQKRSAAMLPYTFVRDYEEQSVWKKLPGGWRELSANMTRDALVYQR